MKGFSGIASTEVFVAGDLAESFGSLSEQDWLTVRQLRNTQEVVKRTRSLEGRGSRR
jgi:hypothetical protein